MSRPATSSGLGLGFKDLALRAKDLEGEATLVVVTLDSSHHIYAALTRAQGHPGSPSRRGLQGWLPVQALFKALPSYSMIFFLDFTYYILYVLWKSYKATNTEGSLASCRCEFIGLEAWLTLESKWVN